MSKEKTKIKTSKERQASHPSTLFRPILFQVFVFRVFCFLHSSLLFGSLVSALEIQVPGAEKSLWFAAWPDDGGVGGAQRKKEPQLNPGRQQ